MKHRLTVAWATRDAEAIRRIRERFGIPRYTTINGCSPAEISDSDMPLLLETARRGFFRVIRRGWRKVGGTYAFDREDDAMPSTANH